MGRPVGSKNYERRFTACVCETCGASFARPTTDVRRGKSGRFCSKSCSNLSREYRSTDPEKRFMAKVNKRGTDARPGLGACWLWTAFTKENGYGHFGRGKGDIVYAHRFSYELHVGPVPVGMCVLHKCDVRNCVRPEHLFIGTEGDNARDRDAKGRTVTPFVPGHTYSAKRRGVPRASW